MTPDQIRWLTYGAIQHRPPGAPKWDEPGTHKAIADHCGTWGLDIATQHVLAHARDPKARTPFAIKGPQPHTEPSKGARFPAKPGDDCRVHPGEWSTSCRACAADGLAGDTPEPPARAAERPADHMARLRVIHDETAADAVQPPRSGGELPGPPEVPRRRGRTRMSTYAYRIEVTRWPTDDGQPWARFYGPNAAVPDNEIPSWLRALTDAALPLLYAYRDPSDPGRVARRLRYDDARNELVGVLMPLPRRVNYLSPSGVSELAADMRAFGADVAVRRSKPIEWEPRMTTPATPPTTYRQTRAGLGSEGASDG